MDTQEVFEDVHDQLNTGQTGAVASLMETWHPAILGQMLEAVAEAKRRRYPGPHPDYEAGVQAAIRAV